MKKKLIFPIIVAFLSVALLSPLLIETASAAYIFNDGFESGNLNAWSVTYGSLSINSQTVNSGIYSVENNIVNSANENLYYQVLGNSLPDPLYLREYIYINSTSVPSTNGDYYEVGGFSTTSGGNFGDGEICVFNVGGILYWGLFYRDARGVSNPSGFTFSISNDNRTSDAHPVSIGWTCVELKQHVGVSASTPDGEEQLYVNGNSVLDVFTTNFDRTPADVVIGGSQNVLNLNDRWNYYIDDVVVNNAYIGPLQMQLTTASNYGTVTPASGLHSEGSSVTITATPPTTSRGERYVFNGWVGSGIGDYTGMNNPATVTMGSNITETATWEHQYELTVISPQGVASNNNTWFDTGTPTYATISPSPVGNAQNSSVPIGTQYVFTNWSGDATGTSTTTNTIIMNSAKTAIANWKTQYYLTTTTTHGVVSGGGWYDAGNAATVTLDSATSPGTPGIQYSFTNWGTDATGIALTSNPITMNGPKTASTLWQTQYNLTVTQSGVNPDYNGTLVTVNGNAYNASGYSIWANANAAYTFNYTSQAVVSNTTTQYLITAITGNTSATSVIVTQPTIVTATYKTQYYLTVNSNYDSPTPTSGWYDSGTSITAYVSSPASGYYSSGWSGTGSVPASGSISVASFSITAPSSITWNWVSTAPTPTPTVAPTPTPHITPTPSASPTPTPRATPTAKPTNSSPTPTATAKTNVSLITYVAAIVVVVILAAIAGSIILIRKRKKP